MDKFSALALSIFFRIFRLTGTVILLFFFSLSFIIHIMQLYSTLSFIQNISLFLIDQIWIAWNQLRSGGKGQRTGSKRNKWWPGGGRGQGGNVAEPRDMPLMPPFYDISLVSNVFMLTDLRCCGQYRGLSISCTYNSGKDFKIWTRTRHFSSLYPFSFPDYLSACFASL